MNEHVFLTGATGFLGKRIARRLSERGRRLHALIRPTSEVEERENLSRMGVTLHPGDLLDRDSVFEAISTARGSSPGGSLDVIHCAALISYRTRDLPLQESVNVGGTRNTLDAARELGIRRFLQISSVVTVGHAAPGRVLTEESAYNGDSLRVDYVDTKRAAEALVLQAAEALDVVVANPGAIFGPSTPRSNSGLFLRRMAAGGFRYAPPGTVGVVGVEDAAEGCILALERGKRGGRYLLVESCLEFLELMREVGEICGVPGPARKVPRRLWGLAGAGARVLDRFVPLDRLTPQSMRMVAAHFRVDASRARKELGWVPEGREEVLRRALEGVREA